MDYPYENLGPERFQEFCQALLVKEHPNTQCFPVGQPDGGRDAVRYFLEEANSGFILYQVKFVRRPESQSDAAKWILDVLRREAPKLKKQIPEGAKQYILMTNARGTAHPEVGSVDKLSKLISKTLDVPAICWWRDDLNRRLDGFWDLKWSYPDLMTGPDLIRALVETGISEARERRTAAIKAFIQDQYKLDQEVRFKQVELQNKLLDLFIDVPLLPPRDNAVKKYGLSHVWAYQYLALSSNLSLWGEKDPWSARMRLSFAVREGLAPEEGTPVGAATFLLSPLIQANLRRVVLEGAPGQGKSTIAQYVCQVHRMRILNKLDTLKLLPNEHKSCPVRLPFKIDLRDLGAWLARKDPFAPEADAPPSGWSKSLESFLAAQIRHHSGGADFDVNDLLAVARVTALLLVFDGLDEVADIGQRQEVVDEIVQGVERLEANAASVQAVVTSRPAAFANSPGLPEETFPYLVLDSITRHLIDEYADKWLRARKLQGRESADVKKILGAKLDQPHLRDLARSPMQLAILLSLIHTRGSSLPDKRTSLYDSYIDLFFNREAEKSPVVREHRDLLINIHRFLAWFLHKEAEQIGNDAGTRSNAGSIREDDLHDLLASYLRSEGHDPELSRILFTGMVERVVALVSRVQGTYEFEVQPLREYFAARYLYETAPYSPPGGERTGTKPDRFDAIARNFYWLNVTRFYAGCYSKGELASLIHSLEDLLEEHDYQLISYPRVLAATLLSDWVFSQHPKSVQEVLSLVVDARGLRHLLVSSGHSSGSGSSLVLAKPCGRDELLAKCFEILTSNPPADFAADLANLMSLNSTLSEIMPIWLSEWRTREEEKSRGQWLELGLGLGLLSRLPAVRLVEIAADGGPSSVQFIYRARRFDVLEGDESLSRSIIDAFLCRDLRVDYARLTGTILEMFGSSLDSRRHLSALGVAANATLPYWDGFRAQLSNRGKGVEGSGISESLKPCLEFIQLVESQSDRDIRDWTLSLEPWELVVEKGRSLWGERWALYHMAIFSGVVKARTIDKLDFSRHSYESLSLCRRVQFAKSRMRSVRWWQKQVQCSEGDTELMFVTSLLLVFAAPRVLLRVYSQVSRKMARLCEANWRRLFDSIEELTAMLSKGLKGRALDLKLLPPKIDDRMAVLLALKLDVAGKIWIYDKYLATYAGNDVRIMRFCCDCVMEKLGSGDMEWNEGVQVISQFYLMGGFSARYSGRRVEKKTLNLPFDVAIEIARDPNQYPNALVALADARCKEHVSASIVPVGRIAERELWFG